MVHKQVPHNHAILSDAEIDFAIVSWQVIRKTNPKLHPKYWSEYVVEYIRRKDASCRMARYVASTMLGKLSDIGLRYKCPTSRLETDEEGDWQQLSFTDEDWKIMSGVFVESIEQHEGGRWVPCRTERLNEMMTEAVNAQRKRDLRVLLTVEQTYRMRCRFGFATTQEIRSHGLLPGSCGSGFNRRDAVVQEIKRPTDQYGTIIDRIDRLEQRDEIIERLTKRIDAMERNVMST